MTRRGTVDPFKGRPYAGAQNRTGIFAATTGKFREKLNFRGESLEQKFLGCAHDLFIAFQSSNAAHKLAHGAYSLSDIHERRNRIHVSTFPECDLGTLRANIGIPGTLQNLFGTRLKTSFRFTPFLFFIVNSIYHVS